MHFVVSDVSPNHPWVGKAVKEITLPPEVMVAVIYREDLMMIPKPNTVIEGNDRLILGSHFYEAEDDEVVFTEILIKSENPWVGKRIRDLDITRRELVVRIRRKGENIIPDGDTVIKSGDYILLISGRKNA